MQLTTPKDLFLLEASRARGQSCVCRAPGGAAQFGGTNQPGHELVVALRPCRAAVNPVGSTSVTIPAPGVHPKCHRDGLCPVSCRNQDLMSDGSSAGTELCWSHLAPCRLTWPWIRCHSIPWGMLALPSPLE